MLISQTIDLIYSFWDIYPAKNINKEIYRWVDRQIDRQIDRWVDRQIDTAYIRRKKDRQMDGREGQITHKN